MNEKIKVTDEWLYQYMPIVDEAMIRALEKETDYDYQFSGRFERKMKKLIQKCRKRHLQVRTANLCMHASDDAVSYKVKREARPWIGAFYRSSKRAALLFACVLSSMFVIAMSVQAYRTRLFETVKSIWEDSILYSYFVDQDPGNIQCNEPQSIPEGYDETERIILGHWFSVTYTNEGGKIITWDQMLVQDGGKLFADMEYEQQLIKDVNGKKVVISLYPDGFAYAYCEYGEYVYVLTADDLSIDEICMIFDSIEDN